MSSVHVLVLACKVRQPLHLEGMSLSQMQTCGGQLGATERLTVLCRVGGCSAQEGALGRPETLRASWT